MTKNPLDPLDNALEKQLDYLKLPFLKENFRPLAAEGNAKHWSHLDYLALKGVLCFRAPEMLP
jgi:hypothetical protein